VGRTYDRIDERLSEFLAAQHVFFVATAPLSADGHLNLSPKGLETFRILGPRTVAYLDLTGSGVETVAHVRENGRIVLLFCAFEGPPKIVRLHGRGRVMLPEEADFEPLRSRFPPFEAVRSIIRVDLERISDSCGYGIPQYRYVAERPQLGDWARRKGPEGVIRYREEHNARSIDGLPGLPGAGGGGKR
jgi:hypothetical protein